MANATHLNILREGVGEWNRWCDQVPDLPRYLPDLSGADLKGGVLSGANLFCANLEGAVLTNADLRGANLGSAQCSAANLVNADLTGAHLSEAKFRNANLQGAQLVEIKSARYSSFFMADLTEANLLRANFEQAYLTRANLTSADLRDARLCNSDMLETNLLRADLSGANLTGANLTAANLVRCKIMNSTLDGCRVYGASVWDLQPGAPKSQSRLVITPPGVPEITVDDIEVAQFIYLLIGNGKIRNVIDTVAKKAVLILGRFTEERKAVLYAIANRLRTEFDLVPIVFDFKKSEEQDIIETVATLASLSKFVIADVTEARVVADELRAFVQNFAVPVIPIFHPSDEEPEPYASLQTLQRKYHWVSALVQYKDVEELMGVLDSQVVERGHEKRLQLRSSS